MANALYDKGREGFLDGSIDWDASVVAVSLPMPSSYSSLPAIVDVEIEVEAATGGKTTFRSRRAYEMVKDAI